VRVAHAADLATATAWAKLRFTCHGRAGQGGNYYGTPTLAKTELPFEGFKQQLRDPMRVTPAYSDAVVSDKEAADIYAFLQTLSGRRPVKDFPILNNLDDLQIDPRARFQNRGFAGMSLVLE
jgi:hypothetical protein